MKAVLMYQAYFQLQKRPFSATPDPTCFFAPGPIQELFDELVLRAESGQGIGILTAEAGTGKTLVCRRIAAELGDRFTPVFLANANVPTRRALLQSILFELKKRFSGLEEQELRLAVYAALRQLTLSGRGAVLIIDEAHLLNERLLEELRMLASLAEGEEPLARLVLAGQPPLEERLVEPALAALNQRIICQVYLEPLTRQESIEYVNYRIRWAGGKTEQIFTPPALESIAAACNGLPRCINQLCDHVMLLACVQELPRVTDDAVREALDDLRQLPLQWTTPVASEAPLEMADDASPFPQSTSDSDDIGLPAATAEDVARRTGHGATVCFEVGGAVEEVRPMDGSTAPAGVKPFPALSAWAERAVVAEEQIDDRYAALDVHSPRRRRTFEDCAIPESWHSPQQVPLAQIPLPAAPSAGSPADEAHMQVPVADYPDGGVAVPGESASHVPEYVSFENLDVGSRLAYDSIELEAAPLEEQLGSSILDACAEVRTAPGQWQATGGGVHSIEDGHTSVTDSDHGDRQVPGTVYDVIEPVTRKTADGPDAGPDSGALDSKSTERYVPKPKYRHVFSTLRRRLGRGLIGQR
jgi:type II secretory pathway predicted ATPase ExeA